MANVSSIQEATQAISLQLTAAEEHASRCEADVLIEREWRRDLQEKEQKSNEDVNTLQLQIKKLCDDIKGQDKLQAEIDRLRKQWAEAQTTLEELGIQLSVSKLKISELQEQIRTDNRSYATAASGATLWSPDESAINCKGCVREFNLTRRKVCNDWECLYLVG